ncbi:HAD family phosphatase [Treponema sp. HNW]|uniref:HAD family hydrolase n=1 Tax=Treponema sp. HNW TaxID=3116654 RepID=UPI003D0A4E40
MKKFNITDFDGAVFDMDGTLVDSMRIWQSMGSSYIRSKGLTPEPNLDRTLYPLTIIDAADYLNTRYNLGMKREDVIAGCNAVVEEKYRTTVGLKPAVPEFLKMMEKHGIKASIATATDRHLVEIVLERLKIDRFFTGIVTSTEAGSAKADSPVIFHKARELLGTSIEKTVVFEDAFFAVRTAKQAGYPVAALHDETAQCPPEKMKEYCDWYAESFREYM